MTDRELASASSPGRQDVQSGLIATILSRTTVRIPRRALAIAAAFAAIGLGRVSLRAGDAPLVITNVTALTGESLQPQTGTVVVADGRIRSIDPEHSPGIPGAAVVDGGGGYLVPGFIDMHAHLMVPRCVTGPDGSVFDRAVSERMLSVLLDFGITSVTKPGHADDRGPAPAR